MDEFFSLVSDVLQVPQNSLTMDTAYKSIPEWDSLAQLRLVVEIEEKYSVEIPCDDVSDLKRLADFYQYTKESVRR